MKKLFPFLFAAIIFLGIGCTPSVTQQEAKTNAEQLNVQSGSTIIVHQTVRGLDGIAVDLLGGQSANRTIAISDWKSGDHVALKWNMQTQEEIQASVDARTAYDAKYKTSPIGASVPQKPDQQFETKTHQGSITSTSLATSRSIFLPSVWVDGDAGTKSDNGILWISTAQYDELVNTKKTALDLGLFDDSIANALGLSDAVQNTINLLKKDAAAVKNREDVLSIVADQNFGTATLMVDGSSKTVQTIEASNWFGHYSILANRDNPLILSVTLSPASKGSLNIFSKENFLSGFGGYKVSSITTK